MGTPPEPRRGTEEPLRSSRRIRPHDRRLPRRAAAGRRSFASTLAALDELAESGAKVAVRVTDLDRGDAVLSGDDFITLPIGGLGVVPLLVDHLEELADDEGHRLDALDLLLAAQEFSLQMFHLILDVVSLDFDELKLLLQLCHFQVQAISNGGVSAHGADFTEDDSLRSSNRSCHIA